MRRPVPMSAAVAIAALAMQTVSAQDKFELVEARIRTLAPSVQSIVVSETPMNGILQVQVGNDIVYATEDGKYLLQGRVIDMDSREDLTEASKAHIRKDILDHVDESDQITFAPGKPVYDLTVFTDIDCGYCRKLHSQIAEYNEQGIAIHYMAFPRAGVGSPSYDKAVSVWCAKDQQSALTAAKAGQDPEPLHCENPELIRVFIERVKREGLTGLRAYSEGRPPLTERLSIAEAGVLADATGVAINLLHLSSRDAIESGSNATVRRAVSIIDTVSP